MRLLFLFAICLLTASSCHEKSTKVTSTASNRTSKRIIYTDAKGTHYKAFGDIQDSLRIPEQKLYAKSMNDVLLNGIAIENNRIVLKYSKEECLKGMTEKQYSDLQENLRVNNHYYDSAKVKTVAEMYADMLKDLKARQSAR